MNNVYIFLISIAGIVILYLLFKINSKTTNQGIQDNSDLALKLSDRWLDTVDTIVSKVLSGRFIAVVLDTIVYPGCVILCGYLTHTKVVEPETFIAVLGGYALLVKETRLKYFDRTDRKDEQNGQNIPVSDKKVSDPIPPSVP